MTTSDRKALQRDLKNPIDLFTLIVNNNPIGVSNQMEAWGWQYTSAESKEQMIGELMKAYNAGGQARDQALALVSKVKYKFGVFPKGYDEAITGKQAPQRLESTDGTTSGTSGDWFTEMDWGGIIAAIFGGIGSVTNSGSGSGNGSTPISSEPSTEDKQSQGMNPQWIVVGVVAIVLIVVLAIVLRK